MLKYPLMALIGLLSVSGCSDGGATITAGGTGGGGTAGSTPGANPQQAAGSYAIPQEELVKAADAIKLSGTIAVKDYQTGILQIDVTLPVEGASPTQGIPPITVARFKSPGPFDLYLPAGTKAVNISLILDLKGNGPDAEDPKLTYAKNPIKIDGKSVTGIELEVDKVPASLPPTPGAGAGDGTAAAAGTGTGIDALSATVGAASGTGTGAAANPAAAAGTSSTSTPGAAVAGKPVAGATAPSSAPGAVANPPGVKPAPVKTADPSGKTATDVLDESLDGAPKVAKPLPATK